MNFNYLHMTVNTCPKISTTVLEDYAKKSELGDMAYMETLPTTNFIMLHGCSNNATINYQDLLTFEESQLLDEQTVGFNNTNPSYIYICMPVDIRFGVYFLGQNILNSQEWKQFPITYKNINLIAYRSPGKLLFSENLTKCEYTVKILQ